MPTMVLMIRDSNVMLPKRNATRSNLKRPISPQFTAPIMDKVRAVASSAVFFMAVYLLIHSQYGPETVKIYMILWDH